MLALIVSAGSGGVLVLFCVQTHAQCGRFDASVGGEPLMATYICGRWGQLAFSGGNPHVCVISQPENISPATDMRVPVSETSWRGESTIQGVRGTLIHNPTSRILGMVGDFQPLDCYEAVDYCADASKRHLGFYLTRQAARDALMRAITKED